MGAIAVGLCTSLLLGAVAAAQPDEEAAKEAAQEIASAQDRANEAAARWSQAESDLGRLEDEAAQLTKERDELQATVDALHESVSKAAAERFMSSGSDGIPILTGYQAPLDQMQADELSRVAAGEADDAFDQYAVSQRDLDRKRDDLAAKQAEVKDQQAKYQDLTKQAEAEVAHLQEVERKRLADERVRLALEAQRREEQRREAERQAALAAQRAAEEAQRAAEQRAAEIQATASANAAAAGRAASVAPVAEQASSATSAAPADADQPAEAAVSSGRLICPVDGPKAYTDTWGAPRPGGRRHEGVDLMSPSGTRLVAITSGTVSYRQQNSNGALTATIIADDGNRYFYGHLSRYEGEARRVSQGELIGYVGNTGTTAYHLHFEVHPGGGGPVNPTPYVRAAGC